MASALHNLQASISRNLVRCLKHSSDISSFNKSRWRSVTSLSFNNSFVDDPCVTDASKPCRNDRTAAILTLKQKEKGDWRNLTLEEKQALYYMSFSQPFCDVFDEPADEWKLILAGAFTTMGLMTLGMYLWLSQNVKPEDVVGPLSVKKELKDVEEITIIHENSLAKTA
ncbi:uncharacterized protein TNIN_86721 [Trichonephila inaurata madagascariensis]|uniref:Cytochrome c oxidase subunit 4 n=1 Tax=Trichonephila inaurata madagascariensis TaxID=2747483 RepID=A0A8X6YXA5_9ARAC|nr:uncharacterized protein TNIN_86721 [Trichonephila inaurata madagascariensis]